MSLLVTAASRYLALSSKLWHKTWVIWVSRGVIPSCSISYILAITSQLSSAAITQTFFYSQLNVLQLHQTALWVILILHNLEINPAVHQFTDMSCAKWLVLRFDSPVFDNEGWSDAVTVTTEMGVLLHWPNLVHIPTASHSWCQYDGVKFRARLLLHLLSCPIDLSLHGVDKLMQLCNI